MIRLRFDSCGRLCVVQKRGGTADTAHDGPAPLTAEDRAAAMPPIDAPPPNPYRTLHARMSPPGAAWDEGFAAGLAARDTPDGER